MGDTPAHRDHGAMDRIVKRIRELIFGPEPEIAYVYVTNR
jgi:hypothetical protein